MTSGRLGAYEIRCRRVRGGVIVWVVSAYTGLALWQLPLGWPPGERGRAELASCERHAPGLDPLGLERELRRQLGGAAAPSSAPPRRDFP